MKDVRGYSIYTLRKNEAAPIDMIGVQLGKVCIEKDITIQNLSTYFGVSRWNIYAWFTEIGTLIKNIMQRYTKL